MCSNRGMISYSVFPTLKLTKNSQKAQMPHVSTGTYMQHRFVNLCGLQKKESQKCKLIRAHALPTCK